VGDCDSDDCDDHDYVSSPAAAEGRPFVSMAQ